MSTFLCVQAQNEHNSVEMKTQSFVLEHMLSVCVRKLLQMVTFEGVWKAKLTIQ